VQWSKYVIMRQCVISPSHPEEPILCGEYCLIYWANFMDHVPRMQWIDVDSVMHCCANPRSRVQQCNKYIVQLPQSCDNSHLELEEYRMNIVNFTKMNCNWIAQVQFQLLSSPTGLHANLSCPQITRCYQQSTSYKHIKKTPCNCRGNHACPQATLPPTGHTPNQHNQVTQHVKILSAAYLHPLPQ
jgi:hypothetical protein